MKLLLLLTLLTSCAGGDLKSVEAENDRYRPYIYSFDTEEKRDNFIKYLKKNSLKSLGACRD